MRIAVINPNSTVSMTDKIAAAAWAVAAPDVVIEALTCTGAPSSIQGPEDGEAAVPFVLARIAEAERDGADACIIACFDDTGLALARQSARIPVLGIGEAAFHAAMLMGHPFSVVTTLAVSIPVIADNIASYGVASYCCNVRAAEVPVLALEEAGTTARDSISQEIAMALQQDGAKAIVLGCGGMADLAAFLTARHGVPVIDGVAAACGFAQALVRMSAATR